MGSQSTATLDAPRKAAETLSSASALQRRPEKRIRESAPSDASHFSVPIAQIPLSPPSTPKSTPTAPHLPPLPLQRKLAIGSVDDPLEREADRVADHVIRTPDPIPAPRLRAMAREGGLHRSCSCCGAKGAHATCKAMNEEREENAKGLVQRKGRHHSSGEDAAPQIVHDVLRSSGQPLDPATRSFFEPRFGCDFRDVRVHTDGKAAESALAVNADAYTVGNHIVFRNGQLASPEGDHHRLLAHELTHVVQQRSGPGMQPLQRACGKDEIANIDTNTCPIVIVAGGHPHGQRFRFATGCDTFAPGEEARLRKFLQGIPSTSELEVLGMASSDGDAGFNEQLACARVNAALAIIKDEHLDQSVKLQGGVGAVSGTFGNPEFHAVTIKETKGGPPIPSSEPGLLNVSLVTGDKPNVIVKDPDDPDLKGKAIQVTLDNFLAAGGFADIPGGADCPKFTLGFFQICRPFDVQRVIYQAKSTDIEDDRSDQINKRSHSDVHNVGDIWTESSVANCAAPGVLRTTEVLFTDKPSTAFLICPTCSSRG